MEKKKINGLINNKRFVVILILVILLSMFARFFDLSKDGFRADIYGTTPGDEAAYSHNARSKVLFNEWEIEGDKWNPMFLSPTLTFFQYLSFRTLGVSTFSSRIAPAVLGFIAILTASFLMFIKNRDESLIFSILLIINAFLIAYSRTGTAESVVFFFLLIILALIIYDKNYSWILAGFFAPFLFFSKLPSIFFILAIPASLILYYFLYKEKGTIKKLFSFMAGSAISGVLWSIWLIPRFDLWYFMNFGFGERFLFTLTKPIVTKYNTFQFAITDPIMLILVLASIFISFRTILKKRKIKFLDFFLIVSLILFYFQISIIDMHLRRFVMIMPILLLIAARFTNKINEFCIKIGNKPLKASRSIAIILIIAVYVFINAVHLGAFFYDLYSDYDGAHTYKRVSGEINDFIPPGSKVYGKPAMAYSLNNQIMPFFDMSENRFIDYANYTLSVLSNEVQYAILVINVFDDNDVKVSRIMPEQKEIYGYIKNNFEIIAVLNSKNEHNNYGNRNLYIYKKMKAFNGAQ